MECSDSVIDGRAKRTLTNVDSAWQGGVCVCDSGGEKHVVAGSSHYSWTEIMTDLLQFAAQYLTLHGRLVFWLPVHRQQYVLGHQHQLTLTID